MSGLRAGWAATAGVLVIGLSACGGADENAVVVRVGNNAITKAMVDRWTNVVRRGGAFTGFRGAPHRGTPRQRALALLISSDWLIGEADRQGLPVSDETVHLALTERMQSGDAREFHKQLEATGQTLAGIELELRAELALQAIRQELTSRASQFSPSQVTAFYRRNRQRFRAPETRLVDIIEGLPSSAAARALIRRVGTGRLFAKLAYHKKLALTPGVLAGPADKKQVDYAAFAARLGIVSRPMRLNGRWTVFVVRGIIAARPEPLAEAHEEVVAALRRQRERDTTATFASEFARRWVDRTGCRPGYVIPGCAQHGGGLGVYEDPFSSAA